MAKQISLRPYTGHMWVVGSVEDYHKTHRKLFKELDPDKLTGGEGGRFFAGEGKDGYWTYLVWANTVPYLVHELTHVLFHVFDRSGINPTDSGGEAFCYMLHTLVEESEGVIRGR